MRKSGSWKNSIRVQLAAIFFMLLLFVMAVNVGINTLFLQKYYIRNKQASICSAYETVDMLFESVDRESDEFRKKFGMISSKDNLSITVADPGMNVICTTEREGTELLTKRLLWKALSGDHSVEPGMMKEDDGSGEGIPFMKERVLATTEEYQITSSTDPAMRADYIELWGYLTNGYLILIRTPLESIRETAKISNLFFFRICLIIAAVGSLAILLVSKKLTDPILELTNLSDRMAHMDFDAKYKGGGLNEVAELGQHMNEMSENLEQSISDLKTANAELQRDIEKKEKIESMRSEFISNVSHELKTPIALINGYAEGLRDGVADDEDSRNEYLGVIIDESKRMGDLVSGLLELNHIEFGNDPVNYERFDICELITGAVSASELLVKQNDTEVIFENKGPAYVWSDRMRTESVFANFFSNAIRYCKGEKKIEIKVEDSGDNVRISIFNTGDPIPEEAIDRIWEKFYKVDKARSRELGGSGVGLSIVKATMDTLNKPYGVINYDNGVSFYFELERAD